MRASHPLPVALGLSAVVHVAVTLALPMLLAARPVSTPPAVRVPIEVAIEVPARRRGEPTTPPGLTSPLAPARPAPAVRAPTAGRVGGKQARPEPVPRPVAAARATSAAARLAAETATQPEAAPRLSLGEPTVPSRPAPAPEAWPPPLAPGGSASSVPPRSPLDVPVRPDIPAPAAALEGPAAEPGKPPSPVVRSASAEAARPGGPAAGTSGSAGPPPDPDGPAGGAGERGEFRGISRSAQTGTAAPGGMGGGGGPGAGRSDGRLEVGLGAAGRGSFARPLGGYQVRPRYPDSARRARIEGTTILKVRIGEHGLVQEIQVERSAGHHDLDRAAIEAVRRWRFEPARRGREPVSVWVLIPVTFELR